MISLHYIAETPYIFIECYNVFSSVLFLSTNSCITDSSFNPCTKEIKKEAETSTICRFINPSNAETSPFRTCIKQNPGDATIKFESCLYDYCAYRQENKTTRNIRLCDDIAAFADSCLVNGYKVQWRTAHLCRKIYLHFAQKSCVYYINCM